MNDGRSVYDPDRLPWLTDDRRPRRKSDSTLLMVWALVAMLLIAGVSYWLGVKSVSEPTAFSDNPFADYSNSTPPAARVRLPEPTIAEPPAEQVQLAPVPEVGPAAEPEVEVPRSEPVRTTRAASGESAKIGTKTASAKSAARKPSGTKRTAARRSARLQAWPAGQSAGAHGRLVRVGTFYTRRQAKQGWSRIVRVYPGMRRLRAVVVPSPSLRNGRTFYRLQFGTTSQAHSEVLCQRMRIVAQSCVVVGLPGRQQGVRR